MQENMSEHETSIIHIPITDEMIAVAAYYKAQKRGFIPGFEMEDWVEAKKELYNYFS